MVCLAGAVAGGGAQMLGVAWPIFGGGGVVVPDEGPCGRSLCPVVATIAGTCGWVPVSATCGRTRFRLLPWCWVHGRLSR